MKNKLSPHRSTGVVFFVAMLFTVFCLPYRMSAVVCDPEADFSSTVSGCDADFTSLYSGPGPVTHLWEFYNTSSPTAPLSSSTVASPHFAFDYTGGTTKYVRHTITLPGGAIKVCEKTVTTSCTENVKCASNYYFYYQVSGCSLTITQFNTMGSPTLTWDFGDGSPTVTSSTLPTHVYTASGTYLVVVNLAGKTCSMVIQVNCEDTNPCCNADFLPDISIDCGVLRLNLKPACNKGKHQWSITPSVAGACMTLVNFYPTLANQNIQITNINTSLLPSIIVQHTVVCDGGATYTSTITVNFPTPLGIFIGEENPTSALLLTNYNCVLPGSSYSSALPIYVSGVIAVDKMFKFTGTHLIFNEGLTGFNLNSASNPLTLSGCRLESGCGCLWRGIAIRAAGAITCNDNTTVTPAVGTTISDALFAIEVNATTPSVVLKETSFTKNFIGIKGFGPLGLSMTHIAFDGTGTIKDICDLMLSGVIAPFIGGISGGGGLPGYQPLFPVSFGTAEGFAGMYIERTGLNLPPRTIPLQNTFSNLAYGIIAYDCNTTIRQNSRFSNIVSAGTYGLNQTAAVLAIDRVPNGINNFDFMGNANPLNPDFAGCHMGIQVRSEQTSPTGMPFSIINTQMANMHTGVFLDARFAGGEFTGFAQNNTITADFSLSPNNLMFNGGIILADFSPGIGKVDISNNEVNLRYAIGGGGRSVGIAADGTGVPVGSGGFVEVDIHDNRVTLDNGAEKGIGFSTRPNGWIRNNIGGSLSSGNGVFGLGGIIYSGLEVTDGSTENLVACNQVTTSASTTVFDGLLNISSSKYCDFLHNALEGPGIAARFGYDCSSTDFRCNDMVNNDFGLYYELAAVTGSQGSLLLSYGNRWISTIAGVFSGGGAFCDLTSSMPVNPALSPYFVRSVSNEIPPSPIVPSSTWFTIISPSAPVDCLMDCPIPNPAHFMAPSPRLTSFDTLVAQRLAVPADALYAEELTWQYEYDLWQKLKSHPEIAQGNSLMQDYLISLSGSNIKNLWNIQMNMNNTLVPDSSLSSVYQANMDAIRQTEGEIWTLDSLLHVAMSSEIAAILEQLTIKNELLNDQVANQETLSSDFASLHTAAISVLMEELSSIVPENICETNFRRAYEIYLQTVASDTSISNNLLAELEGMATQCPAKGGPGIFVAGALYRGFTGILPDHENCDEIANREGDKGTKSLSLYPNPTQGNLIVNIPETSIGDQVFLRIQDARGGVLKNISVKQERMINFDLGNQPNGVYFVSLLINGKVVKTLPFTINH